MARARTGRTVALFVKVSPEAAASLRAAAAARGVSVAQFVSEWAEGLGPVPAKPVEETPPPASVLAEIQALESRQGEIAAVEGAVFEKARQMSSKATVDDLRAMLARRMLRPDEPVPLKDKGSDTEYVPVEDV